MHSIEYPRVGSSIRSLYVWGALLAAVALSAAFSWHYIPVFDDDALISYRYSDRLLHGHGLTWNDGEFVEGYSDVLWVLLVAAVGLFQPDLLWVGRALGLAADASIMVAVIWTFGRSATAPLLSVSTGLLTLALSVPLAIWGIEGLETALYEALIAWSLATAYRMRQGGLSWTYPAVLLGLVAITRPDGFLFAISVSIAVLLCDGAGRAARQRALGITAVPAAFVAAQIAFRLTYYGSPVPNTAYVKLAFTLGRLWDGIIYVAWGAVSNCLPLLVIVAIVCANWRKARREPLRDALLFLVPGCVWLAYVAFIGGDISPWGRHWLPAFVCFSFAVASLVSSVRTDVKPYRLAIFLAMAATLHFLVQLITVYLYLDYPDGHPRLARGSTQSNDLKIEADCISIGRLLRTAFLTQHPLFAVNSAGCFPYASGLPSIDMLGLNDFHIARHRPADMGKGILGHEFGDGAYVLRRKPDIIQLNGLGADARVAWYRGDIEMYNTAEFKQRYRVVFFHASQATLPLWVRIDDGRLGITRSENELSIPGYLFAMNPSVPAILGFNGRLAASLQNNVAELDGIYIPKGHWKFSIDADTPTHLRAFVLLSSGPTMVRQDASHVVSDGALQSLQIEGSGLVYSITARLLRE